MGQNKLAGMWQTQGRDLVLKIQCKIDANTNDDRCLPFNLLYFSMAAHLSLSVGLGVTSTLLLREKGEMSLATEGLPAAAPLLMTCRPSCPPSFTGLTFHYSVRISVLDPKFFISDPSVN